MLKKINKEWLPFRKKIYDKIGENKASAEGNENTQRYVWKEKYGQWNKTIKGHDKVKKAQ